MKFDNFFVEQLFQSEILFSFLYSKDFLLKYFEFVLISLIVEDELSSICFNLISLSSLPKAEFLKIFYIFYSLIVFLHLSSIC